MPDPAAANDRRGACGALLIEEIVKQQMVRPHEAAYFASGLLVFLTCCDERRYGQWEHVPWWDFVGAESRSDEYQKVVARGPHAVLVAAKETVPRRGRSATWPRRS